MKNKYLILAGILNFLTFLLHLIGGQIDLVNPMLETKLEVEKSAQLVGAWQMVSIILIATSCILLSAGFNKKFAKNTELISLIAYLNLAFCFPFILAGFYYQLFVPQWVLFLPIGILALMGVKKLKNMLKIGGID